MIKAVIKNLQGSETNSAKFSTQELAEQWVSQNSPTGAFGKNERWLSEEKAIQEGKQIEDALEERWQDGIENLVREYKFPQEFTVEYVDVSADEEKQAELNYRAHARTKGLELFDEIAALTADKNISFATLMGVQPYPAIMECLRNGWLQDAKAVLQSVDETYYTSQEKSEIVGKITTFLQAEGRE